MPPLNRQEVFTTGQAAQLCQVAVRTLTNWVDSGALAGYRIPGGNARRIQADELLRFCRANGMHEAAAAVEAACRQIALVVGPPALAAGLAELLGGEWLIRIAADTFSAGVQVAGHASRVAGVIATVAACTSLIELGAALHTHCGRVPLVCVGAGDLHDELTHAGWLVLPRDAAAPTIVTALIARHRPAA